MLDFTRWFEKIGLIIIALLVCVVTFYFIKIVVQIVLNVGFKNTKKYNRMITTAKLLINTAKYVIVCSFIISVALIFGAKADTIVKGVGLLSLALGFGAKSLVEDCIAGLFIFFEEHYNVGDTIQVENFKGEVISLGFKSTTLKNWLGDIYVIGNGKIQSVINYSQTNSVAVVKLKVRNNTNIESLELLTEKLFDKLTSFDLFIEKPQFNGITLVNSSGMEVMYTILTKPMKNIEGERILRRAILELFESNKIQLASPKLNVMGETYV